MSAPRCVVFGTGRVAGAGGSWVAKPTRGVHGRGIAFYREFPAALDAEATLDAEGSTSWTMAPA
jgi:hypothetical protein